ncbi:YitT family protein [Miniphocaeibacter halophilus]|uniref:YitT family protein n=1 Tax=Miniphocaeibacter halophilus TaxID=2931922 RepID=A0AC61MUH2_9FIRM|nr:YitT family protein [Miniphocaeibacter halophilus]QQK08250.1 YitT family protein [Miniphocaeibacter halophilus]
MKFFNKNEIFNIIYMIIGTFLIALGINMFFIPHEIVSGGMNGISVILYHVFNISPDKTLFVSNFPLIILSLIFLGKKYTLNTIFCSFLLPIFVRMIINIPPFEGDTILASIFGGIITGLGIGLTFKGGSSTGGTAIPEQIIHDYLRIPLSTSVLLVDGFILLGAFYFFDLSSGLYSLISLFIIGKMVDVTQSGGQPAKTCLVISNKTDKLIYELTVPLYLGVTILDGRGAYTGDKKEVLLCTFPEKTIIDVKNAIYKIDPNAFCLVFDTKEVLGNRWKSHLIKENNLLKLKNN